MDALAQQLGNKDAAGSYTLDAVWRHYAARPMKRVLHYSILTSRGSKASRICSMPWPIRPVFHLSSARIGMPWPTHCAICHGAVKLRVMCCCCAMSAIRLVFPLTTGKSHRTSWPIRWCIGGNGIRLSGYFSLSSCRAINSRLSTGGDLYRSFVLGYFRSGLRPAPTSQWLRAGRFGQLRTGSGHAGVVAGTRRSPGLLAICHR